MIRQTHLSGNAAKVAKYFESRFEEREKRTGEKTATGYYSMEGGAPSEWIGRGAEAQGLAGSVKQEDAIRALSGIVASTGEDISNRGGQSADTRRMGEELTIAAPKSVSILAVEDPRIAEAHKTAVRSAIQYVEKEMVHARLGKSGGKGTDFTENLTAAAYLHEDARDSQSGRVAPHLHSHVVIANMTQRSDGTWSNLKLDWGHGNEKKMTADAVYKAALAKNLKELGYEIEKGKGADFEIAGITREQIEHFSPRSQDIKSEIGGDRDSVSAKERETAQNKTKGQKGKLDHVAQRYEWRKEARDQGLDLAALRKEAEARATNHSTARAPGIITAEQALQSAIRHLSERDTTFSRDTLRQEALAAGLGDVSPSQVDQAIEDRKGGLISAGAGKGLRSEQFTTRTAVLRESEILQRAREGKGQAEAIIQIQQVSTDVSDVDVSFTQKEITDGKRTIKQVWQRGFGKVAALSTQLLRGMSQRDLDANEKREDPELLHGDARSDRSADGALRRDDDRPSKVDQIIGEREKAQGFSFSQGQRAAVALALTSQDRHLGIVGAAGAGKTTAMAAIVEHYQKAGYEVIGVAPSAAAARELESAGCETKTLAKLLAEKPSEESGKKLYVLDEAGMVSSKDYDAFLKKADSENARTLSVGDPFQLQSVEAGTAFKQLLDSSALSHVKIDEIQRQRDPQLREIAQAFARGDAKRGVELAKPYMMQVRATEEDFTEAALEKTENTPAGAKATEKMLDFAKDKGWDGGDDFAEVRKFLDEKAYEIGLNNQNAPSAPADVRRIALARTAASRYLNLTPEERSKTLLLAATNQTRQKINEKVRNGLIKEGTLGEQSVTIVALDKLDLTRESATLAENYRTKDGTGQIVVQFDRDYKEKDKDGNKETLAERGSQWNVISNVGGKLTLQSWDDSDKGIELNPAKAKLSAYLARDMELRDGDQVMFRQNDKNRGITNGMQGIVQIGENGQISVQTRAGQNIELQHDRAHVLDYSYARTVHSAQGATVERAIVIGEASRVAAAEAAYVACSREKLGLQIITDDTEKLGRAWEKFSDRQTALATAREQHAAPQTLEEIQQARREAGKEVGSVGDLSLARASGNVMSDLQSDRDPQKSDQVAQAVANGADEHEAKEAAERGEDPAEAQEQEPGKEAELEVEMEAG